MPTSVPVGSPPAVPPKVRAEAAEPEPTLASLCGFTARDIPELDAHFLAVFTPADGIGADGVWHSARGGSRAEQAVEVNW